MKNLISISGRIGAGKDLVGTIIQYLTWKNKVERKENNLANYKLEDFQRIGNTLSNWKIKKFADKLKDIVCILIGCTRADLEDRNFKEKELGEEWDKYEVSYRTFDRLSQDYSGEWHTEYYSTLKEAEQCTYGNLELDEKSKTIKLIKLTPRLMLQLIGTECFRNIIHPNTWVNSLFSEYKCPICNSVPDKICFGHSNPNWIITDTRFLNELDAVKSRGGLTIKVIRTIRTDYPEVSEANNPILDKIRKSIKEITEKYPCKDTTYYYKYENKELPEEKCRFTDRDEQELRQHLHETLPDGAYVHEGKLKVVTGKGGEIDFRIHLMKEFVKIPEEKSTLHESETALDSAHFDYIIENNSNVEDLIEKVRLILIKERIIQDGL